ncbi:TetR/AcrR family transcriptional regulator [Aliikangiella coralliicola]|nr:TetR/AcrR family transcriptional regulator [Aliikangiella coralliicola]
MQMKQTSKKEQTRKRIIEATIEGVKQHGYGGLGVDAIAKSAKVTSGAFYGHFKSKKEAFEAATLSGMVDLVDGLSYWRDTKGDSWLVPFIDWYLDIEHRKDICGGCALPGLSVDVSRSEKEVHVAYESQLVQAVKIITSGLPGSNTNKKKKIAWSILSTLSGAVIMSRAVDDEKIASEIAEAAKQKAKYLMTEK